ncbi:50S ribosomal protein L25 [Pseudodesulfovibrio senegalensis]|uniref:Large ribosomal subunit protein bL25 n=1 Tax=Pseudodesulfovibrio senegalensis TaxID=1721087 RepID=A0A6N6N4D6_9BACT|nr:50S ribosomal protein L25 [Pseudodesulfovibrio senegalensis]KAB1443022.1 50S ribosomal protein L25 [Pseudodesulfovibrio senegalensis]
MAKKLLKLSVAERKQTGKGPNRRLRATGMVPGVFYNQEGVNIPVKVERTPLQKAWAASGSTQVIDLEIDRDGKTENIKALIWRLKYDPVKPLPIHVDFFGVDVDKVLKVAVPFVLQGTSIGVKMGGMLEQYRDMCEIHAKPLDIPTEIVINIENLNMGDKIHVQDLEMPEGVEAIHEDNYAILTCLEPGAVPDFEEEEAEAAEAEAAEAAEGEAEAEAED